MGLSPQRWDLLYSVMTRACREDLLTPLGKQHALAQDNRQLHLLLGFNEITENEL